MNIKCTKFDFFITILYALKDVFKIIKLLHGLMQFTEIQTVMLSIF